MVANKWSKNFWLDLLERVGTTFLYGLIALLTTENLVESLTAEAAWTIVLLPTLLSALKGLLANMADAESGASALPHPPGPDVQE